jgi:hypothetical protein
VHAPIRLVVALEVDAGDRHTSSHRLLPDRRCDSATEPVDDAWRADVDGDDVAESLIAVPLLR